MKQQLSELIDGEFDIDGAEHLLTAAKSDGEANEAWQHYHLIGDVIRQEAHASIDIKQGVLDALGDAPAVLAPTTMSPSLFKKPRVWSVAASVAAVMFVGLMLLQNNKIQTHDLAPVQIANDVPSEYLQAHQTYASARTAYYVQNASYDAGE